MLLVKKMKTIEMYKTLLQNITYKMFKDKIYGYVQDSYIYTIILEYKRKAFWNENSYLKTY